MRYMNTDPRFSLFNPPVAPVKGPDGRIIKGAELRPLRSVSLSEIFALIRGEGQDNNLPELIKTLRSLPDHDQKREFKNTRLPFVIFQGEFSPTRKKARVVRTSDLLCLDLDHIGTIEQIQDLKERLGRDPDLGSVLLFVSPSGDGLKVVISLKQGIRVSPQDPLFADREIKRVFRAVDYYLRTKYNLTIDQACKNIDRTCYLSYDPTAVLYERTDSFDWEKWEGAIPPQADPKPAKTPVRAQAVLRDTLRSYDSTDEERIKRAVEDIESSGVDITSDYHNWVRLGYALAKIGEAGRPYYHRISRFYTGYDPDQTDHQFTSCLSGSDSSHGIEALFGIARDHGITLRADPAYIARMRSTPEEDFRDYTGASERKTTNPSDQAQNPVKMPNMDQIKKILRSLSEKYSTLPKEDLSQVEDLLRSQVSEISRLNEVNSPDWLLSAPTEDQIVQEESSLPEGLITGYRLLDKESGSIKIELSAGSLTGVVAPTNHGKTALLLNLILNVAKKYPKRRFILLTYEQRANTILQYLLNIYLEDLTLAPIDPDTQRPTKGNRKMIREYFTHNKSLKNIDPKVVNDYNLRKNLFFNTYIETGRILIKYIDSDVSSLCNQLRYVSSRGIGGVFVDYMQFIPKDPRSKAPTRQEELKQICISLKDTANETGLPIVLACQFNREVLTPLDLHASKIGEAGDIERIMSEIYGIWDLSKGVGRRVADSETQEIESLKRLSENLRFDKRGNETGLSGLYIKILKGRDIPTGVEDIIPYRRTTTQRVVPNDPQEEQILRPDWEFIDPM